MTASCSSLTSFLSAASDFIKSNDNSIFHKKKSSIFSKSESNSRRTPLLSARTDISSAGLPNGIFSNQKSRFWLILEDLAMEGVGIFYGHSVYFAVIWYILWPFSIIYGHLVHFFLFWYVVPRKIWQPISRAVHA
jgi:hypothetical protein